MNHTQTPAAPTAAPACTPPTANGSASAVVAPASTCGGECFVLGAIFPAPRNAHQWHHVADFLAVTAGTADARDGGKRSATARAADVSAIPDGNHGDNKLSTVTGDRS